MPETDSVGANMTELLGAAADLRRGPESSGSGDEGFGGVTAPSTGNAVAQAAVNRAVFLVRNLPGHYRERLAAVADALVQGAVDISYADDPTGEV